MKVGVKAARAQLTFGLLLQQLAKSWRARARALASVFDQQRCERPMRIGRLQAFRKFLAP